MFRRVVCCLVAAVAIACWTTATALAQTYKVIHNLGAPGDGFYPNAGVTIGPGGYLYGTTFMGGVDDDGTVFQMKPNPDGSWSESLIHDFINGDPLGNDPVGSVTFDGRGNLYSTANIGGAYGFGTVFELTPNNGSWVGTVLHAFTGGWDGGILGNNVLVTSTGKLYGGNSQGGTDGKGVVFSLNHVSALNWYELVLHDFGGPGDGISPGGLISDRAGNLYGIAAGGPHQWGIVFKLTPDLGGAGWTETILHAFTGGLDGGDPNWNLVMDAAGNLYGTTYYGGGCGGGLGDGVAFELSSNPNGTWNETVIHAFGCSGNDVAGGPLALTFDNLGNLYGESSGTVFKLTPSSNGTWSLTILHAFINPNDGEFPSGGVVLDGAGNIYGTTQAGGTYGMEEGGVVFEITP